MFNTAHVNALLEETGALEAQVADLLGELRAHREENARLRGVLQRMFAFGDGARALVESLTALSLTDNGTNNASGDQVFGSDAVTVFINPAEETIMVADPNHVIDPVVVSFPGGDVTVAQQMLIIGAVRRLQIANGEGGTDPVNEQAISLLPPEFVAAAEAQNAASTA
ncbi:hypothetical protein KA529_04640 [Candidatus Saccharibacteria bacterium]|nr:hypothetical protein [Candidatus Saccharibacteria bacterium]